MPLLRFIIGRIILLVNFLTSPRSIKRAAEQQQVIDSKIENLSLYQLEACPFCVKVRRQAKRQNMKIELRNIKDNLHSQALETEGGKRKVPCLRIDNQDGSSQWMYESKSIVAYLDEVATAA